MKRVLVLISVIALTATACASASEESQGEDTFSTTTPSVVVTTTVAETTTTTQDPPPSTPTDDQDAASITALYEVVFSSETTYEEKAPLIDDPTGLEETVAKYSTTGESMGGVSLAATSITVSGDTAEVTYDLLFGGNPTYPDLTGDAVRVDGTWLVTRELFCSIMASARVGCPSS
jgi:hypothetical protein